MISNTNAGLQRLLDLLNETGKRYGMKVNVKKTKVLRVSKLTRKSNSIKIKIDGIEINQVKIFCYLGSIISEDGRCENDIRCRLGMAKSKFIDNIQHLTGRTAIKTKKNIIKTLIWSIALYASECWTMRKSDIQRIEAFEMWCWRKMLKIKYTDHITNEEVLLTAGESRNMMTRIRKQQQKWIGHNLRHDENLLTTVLEGKMKGKPARGRRCGFLDYLKQGKSYYEIKRCAKNRNEWKCWTPWTCQVAEH